MTAVTHTAAAPVPHPGASVPAAPALRRVLARRLVERALADLPVRLRYPDGRVVGGGGPAAPAIEVVRPDALYARLGAEPKVGIGESYAAGDWHAATGTDLADALTPFAAHLPSLLPAPLWRLRRLVDRAVPDALRNTRTGARANISAHYDLSNELFAAFLDPTMTYSSAWFADDEPLDAAVRLEEAQLRKIDAMLDLAAVRPESDVLEIGTGWGALAIRAAQRGARVTTITLSQEQAVLARRRVADAGLSDRVDVRVQDYREVTGTYDAIVSVEMIEAVGDEFWPDYFGALDRLLAVDGRVALQTITMAHERYLASRRSVSWINKHIFPGGIIPSLRAIDEVLHRHTRLHVSDRRDLDLHYARTLRLWRERFLAQWPHIHALGFDESFRRLWELYLAYSEAGFRSGYLGVSQLALTR
ncbi:MAG TPA: cyclopropane-fatty-acyl-phospholipid synthase family protein [Mycobacteriales bacterium]|nr:cyclopropane-fatty-acyl-phospholipid synthase family protein [Mycobacteriales bacterium]